MKNIKTKYSVNKQKTNDYDNKYPIYESVLMTYHY